MELKDRMARIRQMERYLDEGQESIRNLAEALEQWEEVQENLQKLFGYYGSLDWFSDLEADERGELPKDLKRGVLSEDAVYNLIADYEEMKKRLGIGWGSDAQVICKR